jgi:5-methylcytosine-specific restriction endonuclease McrA
MKRCSQCGEIKPEDQFYKSASKRDGLHSSCKACESAAVRKRRLETLNLEKEREHIRKWRHENRERFNAQAREYRQNQSEEEREKVRLRTRKYYMAHKEEIIKRTVKNNLLKQKRDPKYRLNHSISSGILQSLKHNKNGHHWEDLVGYTLNDLQHRLETQFELGMTWENYGKWHIDHIIPISAFMFSSPDDLDFKRCWALENLRPLWANENNSKGNILIDPLVKTVLQQTSLRHLENIR